MNAVDFERFFPGLTQSCLEYVGTRFAYMGAEGVLYVGEIDLYNLVNVLKDELDPETLRFLRVVMDYAEFNLLFRVVGFHVSLAQVFHSYCSISPGTEATAEAGAFYRPVALLPFPEETVKELERLASERVRAAVVASALEDK